MTTSYVAVNLPYGAPDTDVSIKMYSCSDASLPTTAENCGAPLEFANVQPMVDSTGRANDLFRRVESRIELYDTSFPVTSFGLAMTDPSNTTGIAKDFYATNNCSYSSSKYDTTKKDIVKEDTTCKNASGKNGE